MVIGNEKFGDNFWDSSCKIKFRSYRQFSVLVSSLLTFIAIARNLRRENDANVSSEKRNTNAATEQLNGIWELSIMVVENGDGEESQTKQLKSYNICALL